MLVNGRLSDRSYRRYQLVRFFMRKVFADVDHVCAQTPNWAQRYVDIGANRSRVTVTGSVKFDALTPSLVDATPHITDDVLDCFGFAKKRLVFIAASTLRGEEKHVLRVFTRIRAVVTDALLIIAPRHPERFDEVHAMARLMGIVCKLEVNYAVRIRMFQLSYLTRSVNSQVCSRSRRLCLSVAA
ncbi:MAG: hypothetical protein Ct9H300mP25_16450 [Acidobacteriota bacterium]|nr:MAG: hypothetical protein Ct9H300mP25_16450 [Acidobacteriota bacterium]